MLIYKSKTREEALTNNLGYHLLFSEDIGIPPEHPIILRRCAKAILLWQTWRGVAKPVTPSTKTRLPLILFTRHCYPPHHTTLHSVRMMMKAAVCDGQYNVLPQSDRNLGKPFVKSSGNKRQRTISVASKVGQPYTSSFLAIQSRIC